MNTGKQVAIKRRKDDAVHGISYAGAYLRRGLRRPRGIASVTRDFLRIAPARRRVPMTSLKFEPPTPLNVHLVSSSNRCNPNES